MPVSGEEVRADLPASGEEVRADLPAPGEEHLPGSAKADPVAPAGLPGPESAAAAAALEAKAEVAAEALRNGARGVNLKESLSPAARELRCFGRVVPFDAEAALSFGEALPFNKGDACC